jgi:hypothetical protein
MKLRILFIAALSVLLFVSPASSMPPAEARAWRDDLRFMARELEQTHKDLFHAVTRGQFTTMLDALDAKIPLLERHEVIVEMAKIVAAIGDGHTNIYPTRDPRIGFHTLPVAFTFFGDELYIRATHESQRSLLGARIVRIGDQDVADAYAAMKAIIGRDNDFAARYWAPYLLEMPEVLHALRITRTVEDVPLTIVTSRGQERVTLHPFAPVEVMTGDAATLFNPRKGWIDVRRLSGRPDPLWLRGAADPFHFEHSGSLLYVQINRVGDKPDETLAHFAERLHTEVAATRPEKMAIDLRLNRGGDGTLIVPLIRAIIQSETIDRQGRLFAITGPATFSAAQMLVDALEKYTNVTFVGEPTGSRGNAFGDSRKITLPHSGITVRAAIYYWQDWHPMDKREATMPQIPAPLTFDVYRHNVDPALEAIERVPPMAASER